MHIVYFIVKKNKLNIYILMSINKNLDFSLDSQSSFGFPSFFKKGRDGDDIYNI